MSQRSRGRRNGRHSAQHRARSWRGRLLQPVRGALRRRFVDHTPQPETTADKAGVRVFFARPRTAFPEFRPEIRWQTVDGDIVTTFKTYRGTHLGALLGIDPTGRPVHFGTVDVMRVDNGRIVEHWGVARARGRGRLANQALGSGTVAVVGVDGGVRVRSRWPHSGSGRRRGGDVACPRWRSR